MSGGMVIDPVAWDTRQPLFEKAKTVLLCSSMGNVSPSFSTCLANFVAKKRICPKTPDPSLE